MRVLLSAYACEPGRGSESGTGWNWARSLAAAGHRVTVLTRPHGRGAIERALAGGPTSNLSFRYIGVAAAGLRRLPGQVAVYRHYLLWQTQAYRAARELAQEVDVAHHVSWGSLMGGTQLWRLGVPLVFGPVGGGQTVPGSLLSLVRGDRARVLIRDTNLRLAGLGLRRRHYLSRAALVLATNGETLRLARKLGALQAEPFCDSGLPEHFLAAASPSARAPAPMRVLWVGRIMPQKALPLALAALGRMTAPATLTIVGDGPDGHSPLDLADRLGLSGRVRHLPRVPFDQMPAQYRDHDVFLFTSVLDSFGSQLLEAMGSSLPIVALDHQGAKMFVPEEAGIKVAIGTVDSTASALARALDELAANPTRRARMGAASWSYARTQTWSERAAAMTALYERVAGAGDS